MNVSHYRGRPFVLVFDSLMIVFQAGFISLNADTHTHTHTDSNSNLRLICPSSLSFHHNNQLAHKSTSSRFAFFFLYITLSQYVFYVFCGESLATGFSCVGGMVSILMDFWPRLTPFWSMPASSVGRPTWTEHLLLSLDMGG